MRRSRLPGPVTVCRTDHPHGAAGPEHVPLMPERGPRVEARSGDRRGRARPGVERDDVPDEVARLERPGARRIAARRSRVVTAGPVSRRFPARTSAPAAGACGRGDGA